VLLASTICMAARIPASGITTLRGLVDLDAFVHAALGSFALCHLSRIIDDARKSSTLHISASLLRFLRILRLADLELSTYLG